MLKGRKDRATYGGRSWREEDGEGEFHRQEEVGAVGVQEEKKEGN